MCKRIIALYKEGWGKNVIAERVGKGSRTVRRVLKRAGLWDSTARAVRHVGGAHGPRDVGKLIIKLIMEQYARDVRKWKRHDVTWAQHPEVASWWWKNKYKTNARFRTEIKDRAKQRWLSHGVMITKKRHEQNVVPLADCYVRARLSSQLGCRPNEVPAELIPLWRVRIQLMRRIGRGRAMRV